MNQLKTPPAVVIDEALELARQFSGEESVAFINGVLDAVRRDEDRVDYAVSALKVVLISPRNPLNIGAAARAMSNFGFSELRLVNPYNVAFLEACSESACRTGTSSCEFATVTAVADCALVVGTTAIGPRVLEHPLRRLEFGGKLIARKLPSAPVALLFGSEKFGLSNEDMSHCYWLMRIPAYEEHGSMNLGQAVAVCLYEITVTRPLPKLRLMRRLAVAAHLERITELLETIPRSFRVR